jgi:LmbE family N-acetylglucosaminyl deacetylase
VARWARTLSTELILTHAYEGGHPDHDAAAFICHAAAELHAREGLPKPWIVEMPLYRRGGDDRVNGRFLPPIGPDAWTLVLDREALARKRHALGAFVTQRHVVSAFDPGVERYRTAPAHDFLRPPHPGVLHYEHEGWARGDDFRQQVWTAQRALRLGDGLWD